MVIMIIDVRIHSSRRYPPPSWSVWLSNEEIDWLKCSIMRTKAQGDWLRHSCACDFILLLISCMSFVFGFIFFISPTMWPRRLAAFENCYPLSSYVFRYCFWKIVSKTACCVNNWAILGCWNEKTAVQNKEHRMYLGKVWGWGKRGMER